MVNFQILLDTLVEKKIISEEELKQRKVDILERLKPRNFLTREELEEVRACLDTIEFPRPSGWAHALHIHAMKDAKETFSPDKVYDEPCLINLRSTLYTAGLKNKQIDIKLATAILVAQNYKV